MEASSTPRDSLDASYFERMYARTIDPWRFATSAYEAQKYRATLDALPEARYARAFEIGCSIGVLTAELAQRCDDLLAVDVNARALAAARERCAARRNVRFDLMPVPQAFPEERFDLVVVSEVGYYWSDADLALAIDRIAGAAAGGTVELVHYLPVVADYPRTGDAVHEAFLADGRFESRFAARARCYRIDVLHVR